MTLTAASGLLRATDRIEVTDEAMVSYDAEFVLRGRPRALDPVLRPGFGAVAERGAYGLALVLGSPAPGGVRP